MNDKRIGLSMSCDQVLALNAVLECIDAGRDPRVMMRGEAFRKGRAVLVMAGQRARRGDALRLVKA